MLKMLQLASGIFFSDKNYGVFSQKNYPRKPAKYRELARRTKDIFVLAVNFYATEFLSFTTALHA
jgi:hypothetical protein